MAVVNQLLNSADEINQARLKRLEDSAYGWRMLGRLFLVAGSLFLATILISVFRNPSFAKQIPPIYWLLPIWAEASGITFLYIHQRLRRLRFASLASPSTLTLISELRIGLLVFVYLEVAFVLGCLVIYPQAVPFFIGTVFIGPKAVSADRADLWLLEEQVRRNIASGA